MIIVLFPDEALPPDVPGRGIFKDKQHTGTTIITSTSSTSKVVILYR
ncbi:MAG TPA: hypothetical protein PLV96_02750 [Methanoregulaceae archaeon]|nr:hypothetical protein [Methanoregulaceae archaeon]HQA79698.1 hypothetical protein [Methanoregulaceae archaeon]